MSVPFSKNCDDPVGTDVMDSTADFTTVCTECRIEGGMKFAISTFRAKQNNSCVFYSSFCNCTEEKTDDDFELSLSLSLSFTHHTQKKRKEKKSLSLFLSLAFGARTNQTQGQTNNALVFFSSQKTTEVDSDFCVCLCVLLSFLKRPRRVRTLLLFRV